MSVPDRIVALLLPHEGDVVYNYPHLWSRLGGVDGWRSAMSEAQTAALVAGDERVLFRLPATARAAPPGMAACLLARLPCLREVSLRGARGALLFEELLPAEGAFRALTTLDVSYTECCDDDLAALHCRAPHLQGLTLDVRACPGVTWEGIRTAQESWGWTVTPDTEEAKKSDDADRRRALELLDLESAESKKRYEELHGEYGQYLGRSGNEQEVGLADLYKDVGREEWRQKLSPADLTLLFSREKVTGLAFRLGKEGNDMFKLEGVKNPTDFFTNFALRLPKLAGLQIVSAPEWPLDFDTLDAEDPDLSELPRLLKASIRLTPVTAEQLIATAQRVPTLSDEEALEVDLEWTQCGAFTAGELSHICGKGLSLVGTGKIANAKERKRAKSKSKSKSKSRSRPRNPPNNMAALLRALLSDD